MSIQSTPALIVIFSFGMPGVSKVISYLSPKSSMSHRGKRVSKSEINPLPAPRNGHFGTDSTSSISLLKFSKILSNAVGNNAFFLTISDFVMYTNFKLIYFNTRNALHCIICQVARCRKQKLLLFRFNRMLDN